MINAPNRPICSVRSAPNAEPARPSFCLSATPKPCSFISTRSPQGSPLALTQSSSSIRLAGTAPRSQDSHQPIAPAAAAACAGAQPPRKHLAVHATELAVQSHLQILRRYRRSLLLRLEHADRSALENHVHRTPRLGNRRSANLRVGINHCRHHGLGWIGAGVHLLGLDRPFIELPLAGTVGIAVVVATALYYGFERAARRGLRSFRPTADPEITVEGRLAARGGFDVRERNRGQGEPTGIAIT